MTSAVTEKERGNTPSSWSTSFNDRASQVLTITADYHGGVVVLFVVIMQCRKRPLYTKVFRSIKTSQPDFTPAQLMTDYEKAMRRAFSNVYPDSRLYGCR